MPWSEPYTLEFTILIVLRSLHFFRYKSTPPNAQASPGEDLTPDYMNILGMIFSIYGLMKRVSVFEYVAAIFMFKITTVIIYNCHKTSRKIFFKCLVFPCHYNSAASYSFLIHPTSVLYKPVTDRIIK